MTTRSGCSASCQERYSIAKLAQLSAFSPDITVVAADLMSHIGAQTEVDDVAVLEGRLPHALTPNSSKVVALDARSHVDAVGAKPSVSKFSPPSASSRDKILRRPASFAALRPTVRTASRRAL